MTAPSSTYAFDRETQIERTGESTWRTEVVADWNIDTNPNGGYALTPLLRAALADSAERSNGAHPDPLALNVQFLKPAIAGQEATIEVEHLKSGRRITNHRVTMVQDGTVRISLLATLGSLASTGAEILSGTSIDRLAPPELPSPDDCRPRGNLDQGVDLPLLSRVEVRLDPRSAPVEEPTGMGTADAVMAGWIRFQDERPVRTDALPLFCDAFPPSVFTRFGRIGWVPTLELTTHVRRRPVDGWILARFVTEDLSGGLLVEDGTLWDESGAVVARSRQLALLI